MNVRVGELNEDDFKLLDTRVVSNLKVGDIDISDCTHIYPTRDQVTEQLDEI